MIDFIQTAFDRPGRVRPAFERWRDVMVGATNFDSNLWLLAYYGEEFVGAILCFDYHQYGWVRQLGVAGHWRGKGLGSALLQHMFGVFYQRGHATVGLGVDAENPNAYHLYERIGMKRTRQYIEYWKSIG